jgi:hypothetical protein
MIILCLAYIQLPEANKQALLLLNPYSKKDFTAVLKLKKSIYLEQSQY